MSADYGTVAELVERAEAYGWTSGQWTADAGDGIVVEYEPSAPYYTTVDENTQSVDYRPRVCAWFGDDRRHIRSIEPDDLAKACAEAAAQVRAAMVGALPDDLQALHRLVREEAELVAALDSVRASRDRAIRESAASGVQVAAITGLSTQRISQIRSGK